MSKNNNLAKQLLVILLQLFKLLIALPISICLIALGLIFSQQWLINNLPLKYFYLIYNLAEKLPLYKVINQDIINWLGNFYTDADMWWFVVLGIPLTLGGIGMFVMSLVSLIYSITNKTFNKAFFSSKS